MESDHFIAYSANPGALHALFTAFAAALLAGVFAVLARAHLMHAPQIVHVEIVPQPPASK